MYRNHQEGRDPSMPDNGVPVEPSLDPPLTALTTPEPEVEMEVFGPLRISVGGRLLKPSGRAATLLTYLALEDAPLHRMAAARLLWPLSGKAALQNLRVELSVLRRQGLDLSPHRAPHLTLRATLKPPLPGQSSEPLADFNDHGNPLLRDWAEKQRLRLRHLGGMPQPGRSRADLPGASDAEAGPLAWLTSQLRDRMEPIVASARHRPQLLVYIGRQASGRRETLRRLLPELGVSLVELTAGPSSDEMLPNLLLNLSPLLEGGARQDAEALLHTPHPDLLQAQLGRLLRGVRSPLAVVLHNAERLSAQSMGVVNFLMDLPRPLLTVAVTTPAGAEGLEVLLSGHARPGQLHVEAVPLLTTESFADPPGAFAQHAERVRQAEGWLAAATSPELQAPLSGLRARLNADLKRVLRAEISAAGLELSAFRLLAAVPSPFSEGTALKLLTSRGRSEAQAHAILEAGLATSTLERVADVVEVCLPQATARVPDGLYPLAFTSELQRAALATGLDPSERTSLRQLTGTPPASRPRISGVLEPQPTATPARPQLSRTHRLPGGHLLLQGEGSFSVLRLGAPGHTASTLYVQLSAPPDARNWQFDLQLQGIDPAALQAGVHVVDPGSGQRGPVTLLGWGSDLEPDTWYRVTGPLAAGVPRLRLCVQGSDVLAHVTDIRFF
ncbi:hypothetical protein [Deinococcus navajonensis]|uniref:Uncharacterized protein n=1 Tax=Deinococcus navajonensis TaxID=309884 RepID=A0ABV8XIY9_9DEIO